MLTDSQFGLRGRSQEPNSAGQSKQQVEKQHDSRRIVVNAGCVKAMYLGKKLGGENGGEKKPKITWFLHSPNYSIAPSLCGINFTRLSSRYLCISKIQATLIMHDSISTRKIDKKRYFVLLIERKRRC